MEVAIVEVSIVDGRGKTDVGDAVFKLEVSVVDLDSMLEGDVDVTIKDAVGIVDIINVSKETVAVGTKFELDIVKNVSVVAVDIGSRLVVVINEVSVVVVGTTKELVSSGT